MSINENLARSSVLTGSTISEPSVSGAFIKLAQNGQLKRHERLINEFSGRRDQLARICQQLEACNNAVFLSRFAERKLETFERDLIALIEKLESSRRRVEESLAPLQCEIHEICSDPITSLTPPVGSPLYPVFGFNADRETEEHLRSRNAAIDAHLDLSGIKLCSLLDLFFGRTDGRACAELPESWQRRFAVKSFREAYLHPRCGALVRTLISKRRNYRRGCG